MAELTEGVAHEHFDVRQQVVSKAHGLGALQVGVPRQNRVDVLVGPRDQHAGQLTERRGLRLTVTTDPQQGVGRGLVVAATRRVQATPRITRDLGQPPFHGGVNVFVSRYEHEGTRRHLRCNLVEPRQHRRSVLGRHDAASAEHPGVCPGPVDVLPPQPPVHRQRLVEPLERLRRAPLKPPAPQSHLAHAALR